MKPAQRARALGGKTRKHYISLRIFETSAETSCFTARWLQPTFIRILQTSGLPETATMGPGKVWRIFWTSGMEFGLSPGTQPSMITRVRSGLAWKSRSPSSSEEATRNRGAFPLEVARPYALPRLVILDDQNLRRIHCHDRV